MEPICFFSVSCTVQAKFIINGHQQSHKRQSNLKSWRDSVRYRKSKLSSGWWQFPLATFGPNSLNLLLILSLILHSALPRPINYCPVVNILWMSTNSVTTGSKQGMVGWPFELYGSWLCGSPLNAPVFSSIPSIYTLHPTRCILHCDDLWMLPNSLWVSKLSPSKNRWVR